LGNVKRRASRKQSKTHYVVSIQDGEELSEEMPLRTPAVSVIILNYNGKDVLPACLRSVHDSRYSNFEVILVDNGSTDQSVEVAARDFPETIIVRNEKNLGYSIGNNIGIARSKGEYLVLLNNDTVVHPDWLRELVKGAVQLNGGFYQPKILLMEDPKIINSAGNMIHLAGFGLCRGIGEPDTGQYEERVEIGYASGACVFVSRRAIEEVGLLDPVYFAYNEDTDWGWRGRIFGWKSFYIPTAVIYHKWSRLGSLSNLKFYYLERNRIATIVKNYSDQTLILLLPILLLFELAVVFYSLRRGWLREKIKGYVDLFKSRRSLMAQRRQLQAKRRFGDSVVMRVFVNEMKHSYLGSTAAPLNKIAQFLSWIVTRYV